MKLEGLPNRRYRLLFLLLPFVLNNNVYASEGLDAYREGNYVIAAQKLDTNKDNDSVGNYYAGRMRLYGYGVLRNNTSALNFFQQSAEKGFLPAQQFLARYELFEVNNPEKALYWFKKSADANDVPSQLYCAAAYLFGFGVNKNSELAKRYYIAAAKSGHSIAQFELADHFIDSRDASNKKLGLIWLNKAVAQNNPAAQLKLGELYAAGNLVPKDLLKAKEMLALAVAQNYIPAMVAVGRLALLEQDYQKAKDWYQKAIDAHYLPAQVAMAQLYLDPKTPLFNSHTGFLWMLKAAQMGSIEAELAVESMYRTGQGVDLDLKLADDWKKKAAITAKGTPSTIQAQVARWLTNGKTAALARTPYQLNGILREWHNPEALKENTYNQPPQMQFLKKDVLFKPQFTLTNPNDIPINDYYDALASSLGSSSDKDDLSFPRYSVDKNVSKPAKISSEIQTIVPSSSSQGSSTEANADKSIASYLQSRAVLGDSNAQFTLAQMYQQGIDVPKDIPSAIKYYELATALQDLRAEYNLGLLYLEGDGVPADYEKAQTLLSDAAFKGNEYAQFVLALISERGFKNAAGEYIVKPDADQAMAMYSLAADNGFGRAEYRLAEMLVRQKKADMTIVQLQKHNRIIKRLYQKSAEAGITQAALPLAFFNAMESDATKQAQALDVAKKEANDGNKGAALLLGLLYDRGIGVAQDQSEAISWYQKASDYPIASFILGTYQGQGIGFRKDTEAAVSMLQKAADIGFSYATLNLGVIQQQRGETFLPALDKALELGNSTAGLLLADYYLSLANDETQMKQARDIYVHLAEKGDKSAQTKLAYMYEHGLGGGVDVAGAEKWYKASAEQGYPVAQYLLGHFYQLGLLGTGPDYEEAKKWYKAAENNYAPAAVALGFLYETVDDDYKSALASYELASKLGDPIGQFNLGLMYEKGKGVSVDVLKAKEFYKEAAAKGHAQAMAQLAGLEGKGTYGQQDETQALDLHPKAAALSGKSALYHLGLLSETNVGLKLDRENP